MNTLLCSAGRRVELIKDFKKSTPGQVIVTDVSITAPAIYVADKHYNAGYITDNSYIDNLLNICEKEKIDVVTTLIDPEIEILARNRKRFEDMGVTVLCPSAETALLCYDKNKLIKFFSEKGIRTVKTWDNRDDFYSSLANGEICFPVFVKPRNGSGSIGAERIDDKDLLEFAYLKDDTLIIQEYMGDATDIDVDVYVDTVSKNPVSIFSKRKIESKIGGANKTVSFIDNDLNRFIKRIVLNMDFKGPIDIDLFYRDGQYYLSEINPRFGGAYIHAYECGVDFVKMIENNTKGIINPELYGNYEENMVMMMYDSIVVEKIDGIL